MPSVRGASRRRYARRYPNTAVGSYITLSGTAQYVTTPDSAALDITGDIEMVCRVRLTDYTAAANQLLVCKGLSASQISYRIAMATTGKLVLTTTADGSTLVQSIQTAATVFSDNTTYWIKATLDVVSGANRVAVFYYAADAETEPSSWTTIETVTTAGGATSIFAGTAVGSVGGSGSGTSLSTGRFYRTIIRNGIAGTVVADFNAAHARVGDTSVHSSATGEVWQGRGGVLVA